MSRRTHRPSPIKQFILWSLLACVLIVTALGLYGYFWVQNYLRSDAIRVMLEARLGQLTQGEAKLTTLEWSGPAAYISTASLTPGQPAGWRKVEAEGVQSQVDWSGIREGVWRVPVVAMDWLKIELTPPPSPAVPGATPVVEKAPVLVAVDPPTPAAPPSAPAWLQGWIPQRTDIHKVEVASLEIAPPKGAIGTRLRESKVVAKPAVDAGAWALEGRGGRLLLPGWTDELNLQVVNARLDARALPSTMAQPAGWATAKSRYGASCLSRAVVHGSSPAQSRILNFAMSCRQPGKINCTGCWKQTMRLSLAFSLPS
ncbi:hypothetical protein [Verrucomicrobium spinosum]|uniref:hypothetical protein n=1 Tax=Verrucomicrobium spinosum TaxID=2736 RepID=UPI00094676C9|nr:hypothetical protein [Verrucomicrobium spinosum]